MRAKSTISVVVPEVNVNPTCYGVGEAARPIEQVLRKNDDDQYDNDYDDDDEKREYDFLYHPGDGQGKHDELDGQHYYPQ